MKLPRITKAILFKVTHKKPEKSFLSLGGGNLNEHGYLIGEYADYFCWNQNGFNNALYEHFGDDDWDYKDYKGYSPKKDTRSMAKNCYPKKYPCFMRIWSYHSFESGRLYADFEY